jgi:2-polyprenyl-3-methyl-5-hydroxy-6-metoxy-1,4-benzoquinol methylase
MLEKLGLADKVKVREVDSTYFKQNYFASRPRSEKLINIELKKIAPHLTRDWQVCLDEYLKRFNWNLWDLNTSGMDRSFYKNYFKIEKEHWLMKIRRTIVQDSLDRYLGKAPKHTKLLDFGCGSGIFVEELEKAGFDAHGVDISDEAVRFGALQGIKNLSVIDSHKINFSDNTFDVVLSMDVLEHLEDEEWALKEIERILKPNGIFVVMVPAYMFLWGVQDEVAHHYRRYTKGSLLKVVRDKTKLKTVRSSYFNTFLFAPIAIVRLVSRLFNIKGRESDFDLNSPMLNKILFSIFNFERKILKKINFPFGVSILALFKKN